MGAIAAVSLGRVALSRRRRLWPRDGPASLPRLGGASEQRLNLNQDAPDNPLEVGILRRAANGALASM